MTRKRNKHLMRNIGITVAVIIVIAVASAAAICLDKPSQTPQIAPSTPLAVGDTFTYKLAGSTVLGNSSVVTPQEFLEYNDTDYYQVTVTAVEGTQVTLETTWQFKNGTQVSEPQAIDLSTGLTGDVMGFVYLYPSNLSVTDKLYPQDSNQLMVNSTSTQRFGDSSRVINYWSTEDQYMNTGDQSGNTMRYDFIGVNFDRDTGMLVSLTRIEFLTNPEIQLTITWQLTSTNVWNVK